MLPRLMEELERRLETVVAALVPGARLRYASGGSAAEQEWAWWEQSFDVNPAATLTVGMPRAACREIAAAMGHGGLLGAVSNEELPAALLRIFANACATVAPVPASAGRIPVAAPQGLPWLFSIELAAGGRHTLAVLLSPALIRSIEAEDEPRTEPREAMPVLLNVDLPVSISLGRAKLLLRDLLRLSTGSVVELDRALGEAVDVTVNDCVIARGEIVVVEGNYGVRIQNVFSQACRSITGLQGGG